jgi:hypothetical protein
MLEICETGTLDLNDAQQIVGRERRERVPIISGPAMLE